MVKDLEALTVEPFMVRVGSVLTVETWSFTGRTAGQFLRIKEICARPDFQFSCISKVFEDTGKYKGTVYFTWYDQNNCINITRVSPGGRVTKEVRA